MCLAAPLYTPELYAPGVGAHTNVGNVEALKGLTGPNELGLNNTRVKNLDALKELTGLSVLDLQGSQVRDVDVLKANSAIAQEPRRDIVPSARLVTMIGTRAPITIPAISASAR